jgi:hypothetical protein
VSSAAADACESLHTTLTQRPTNVAGAYLARMGKIRSFQSTTSPMRSDGCRACMTL